MAQELTDANIKEIIATGQPVIVDFWATWCGPCRAMAPMVDELAKEYEGKVLIGKYNCDDESDFASANRVMSLPTFLFFKNGERTKIRLAGSQTRENLVAKIDELLAL